jgi:hypothetical protein
MVVILLLMVANIWQAVRYQKLDQNYMQEEGLRDEADSLLRACGK